MSISDPQPSLDNLGRASDDGITSGSWRDFNHFDSSHKGVFAFSPILTSEMARGISSSSSLLPWLDCDITEPCSESKDNVSDSSSGRCCSMSGGFMLTSCSSSLSVAVSDSGTAAKAALRKVLP